jgi:hypothetical protein
MRALPAAALLRLWEIEEDRLPADRALALLGAVAEGEEHDALGALTIGARDARLLELRARTFGRLLQAQTHCPACTEQLEFSLPVAELLAPRSGEPGGAAGWHTLEAGAWRMRFRLPLALDLAQLGAEAAAGDLRRALLERCVDEVAHAAAPATIGELPADVISALASRMEELDPCADIVLALQCARCGNAWRAPFDIVAYLWAEFGAHARRLLREVDALARAYGWREADILAMSSRRRRAYLELSGA